MSKVAGVIIVSGLLFLDPVLSPNLSAASQPEPAPDFELARLGGGTIRLSELRGYVVMISFWATWCRPCLEELPELERLYVEYRDSGLRILSISIDRVAENVERQVEKYPVSFPVLNDPSGEVFIDKYEVAALPALFLVDRSGMIVYKHFGNQNMKSSGFSRRLEPLLEEEKK